MTKHLRCSWICGVLLLVNLSARAQGDTSSRALSITYVEIYQSWTNTPGNLWERSNTSVEFGNQWGVFSMGVDLGKTTLARDAHAGDTSTYLELRPNLNVFQQDKFTSTLTLGVGWIPGARASMLTEFTTGIEYSLTERVHLNFNFGQFYYNGVRSTYSATFWGISVTRFFVRERKTSHHG